MRRLLLLLLLGLLHVHFVPFAAAQERSTLRVMFWNVENLFDCRHDSLKDDYEFLPDAVRNWTYGRYQKKLDQIARTVAAIGEGTPPALMGCCEVENDSVMHQLTQRSPLKEYGYRYVMTNSPDVRGIDVALLYQPDQFQLLGSRSIAIPFCEETERPTRDILHVHGLIPTQDTLDLLVCHLPSRSGGAQSEPYRLRVAQQLKKTADSILHARHHPQLIIMGDFNDYPDDQTLRAALDAAPPPTKAIPDKLYQLLYRKSHQSGYGSYKYQGEWGLLDHLIVSGTLLNQESNCYTDEAHANVVDLPFLFVEDEAEDGRKPYRTYNGTKYMGGYSDHLPVSLLLLHKKTTE
jgi:endonuclease/exonuclease/phosphatase family metal-dependent hydrolase